MEDIQDYSDSELVEQIGDVTIGTPSGMRAQKAQAELTRRLMESIRSMDKSTSDYSFRLLGLTYVLLAATVVLVVLTSLMLPFSLVPKTVVAFGSVILIIWLTWDWFKDVKK